MTLPCGCCTAVEPLTPLAVANRPGLSALVYRAGRYATFFETMKARLSRPDFPALARLQTREADDPAIALLDAWATVADVLTFYQERIANEGYLRTATERRSVLELARLVGYVLRPGVAATVTLAYTLDQNSSSAIPVGSRVQSVPGQDQLPQSFETAEVLAAQGMWNNLAPRLTQPQIISPDAPQVYIDGISANLKPNDPLLIIASAPQVQYVAAVDVQFKQSRTKVTLQKLKPAIEPGATIPSAFVAVVPPPFVAAVDLVGPLSKPPAAHPPNSVHLQRSIPSTFAEQTDTTLGLLKTLRPEVGTQLYTALRNATVTPPAGGEVHAFRVQAAPFGSTAPLKPIIDDKGVVIGTEEWPLVGTVEIDIVISPETGIARAVEALILEGRVGHEANVKIKTSSQTASTGFLLSGTEQTVNVGPWTVVVKQNLDRAAPSVEFSFQPPLNNTVKISSRDKHQYVDVTVDDAKHPIEVASGQAASSTAGGSQISVSFINNIIVVSDQSAIPPDRPNVLQLDAIYDQVIPGSWVAIRRAGQAAKVTQVDNVQKVAVTNYGMTARVTQLTLVDPWLDPAHDRMLTVAREMSVSAQSEKLTLAEEPILDDVAGDQVELGDLYRDLQSGRWLIVQGERTDILNTSGVTSAELLMLGGVEQRVQQVTVPASAVKSAGTGSAGSTVGRPGDSTHSFLQLASGLAYTYKRDTVAISGNVIQATHGETRNEILGSGDGTQGLQKFSLRQPLTHVPALTATGTQSTLQVFVNNVLWREVDSLANTGPSDRCYMTQTDDSDQTTITFGDGVHGLRLPSGVQNVRAVYRTGIGTAGMVVANQASLLVTRPLGVTGVVNPLPATGAADRDSRDQARRNTPLAVAALDRLVALQDYADFARTFSGIGKASAVQLSDGHRSIVYVTIAGADSPKIDKSSGLFQNLLQAFRQLGDPNLPLQVDLCELMLLVISAKVQVFTDYQWDNVAPLIRAALLDAFGSAQRDLAQSVALSDVIRTIQLVPGVAYADVTTFDSISETDIATADTLQAKLAAITAAATPKQTIEVRSAGFDTASKSLQPAQLAFLSPDLPDTLILTEIPL
jgi:predicted phage baseplate assembly protein